MESGILIKVLLVMLTSASASLGNSLLKAGASSGKEDLLEVRHLPRTFLKPAIIGGVIVYGVSQLLWITALRIIDLSLAYPLMIGLNFSLIMSVAWLYFKEPVSPGKLSGVALIFVGIVTIAAQ